MSGFTEQDIEHIGVLSGLQQSMLFRSLAEPNAGHYIEQLSYEFSDFDLGAMQSALDAVIATRSALRTSFLWREQTRPKQLTFRSVQHPIEINEFDVSDSGRLSEEQKRRAIAEDRARGLSLNQAPLMRITVYIPRDRGPFSRESTAFCIWTFHHAVVDGWSIALLQHELLNYYQDFRNGIAPENLVSDAAANLTPDSSGENTGLWDQQLRGATRDNALAFLPSVSGYDRSYNEVGFSDDENLSTRIKTACQTHRVTFANFAHAAWTLLLCHLHGQLKTCYGTIDSGRSELKDGETLVGMFMQLLPVCIDIDESLSLRKFLQGIQRQQWAAQTDRLPSPADMALALDRAPGEVLFDTLLLVQNYPAAVMPTNIGLLDNRGFEQADAPFVLSIGNTDTVRMLARFQTDRVDVKQARMLQTHFAQMLSALADAAEAQTLGDLLKQFAQFSTAVTSLPPTCEISSDRCIDRFNAATAKHPEKIAVFDSSRSFSYAAMAARAEHIREQLANAGVSHHSTVAVFQPRSIDSIASALAILAQGARYVAIDPGFPSAVVETMLADSNSQFVITSNPSELQSMSESISLLPLPGFDTERDKVLSVANPANDAMCVMFTSGSTGKPKAVALTHTAVMNRLAWMEQQYPFAEDEICSVRTPVSFVDSVAEVFAPLCAGVGCRVISDDELLSLSELIRIVEQARVTRISLVPALLDALLSELNGNNSWSSVRLCTVSGEALQQQLVSRFHELLPHAKLLNLYGSTEVAADALYYETSAEDAHRELAAIGKPIDNMNAQVCNAFGQALPDGVIGELYVKGAGVAGAYINDAALSNDKFVDGYFRSGDLAFKDEHGYFHYTGRADRQLKVRGQRVEPGAIESTLMAHSNVRHAAVVLVEQNLICFYTGNKQDHNTLSDFVATKLPAYSLPSRFHYIEELPLTRSGKTDIEQLRQIATAVPERDVSDVKSPSLSLHQKELGLAIGNIWSELLPHASISTATDFFEVGGHSLLAMQMIASVERALGFTVPLAVFMRNTRLGDFAKVIFEGIPKLSAPELITLRDGDSTAPALFCVQGDAYNIVPHCKVDRKIHWISQWSICVDLTSDPLPVPIETIQQTADRYAKHIERVHPKGELCILAACGAAVISIEVARILQRDGRMPNKLVLMDLPRGKLTTASARGFKQRQERNIIRSAYGYAMRVGGGKKVKDYLDRCRINRKINRGIPLTDIEAAELMNIRLSEALTHYKPAVYEGEVELIMSKAWYRGVAKAEDAAVPEFWRPLLPNVSAIHFSTAEHHSDLLQGEAAAFAVNVLEN